MPNIWEPYDYSDGPDESGIEGYFDEVGNFVPPPELAELPEDILERFDERAGNNIESGLPAELAYTIYDLESLVNKLEGTPESVLRVVRAYDEGAREWYYEIYRYDS